MRTKGTAFQPGIRRYPKGRMPILLALALCAFGLACVRSEQALASAAPTQFGVIAWPGEASYPMQRALGDVPIRRIGISWNQVEPSPGVIWSY